MNCVSYDICVYHFCFCSRFFFPGVFFHSRVTGTCPVTTDLILRVDVRTTTTTKTKTTTAFVLGFGLHAVSAYKMGAFCAVGGNTLTMRFHERVAFAAYFSGYLIVLDLGEILRRTSGDNLPWILRLSPPFSFANFPQVPSGLWVTLGGCSGLWGRSSGMPTGLGLIRRHACCSATCNRYWEPRRLRNNSPSLCLSVSSSWVHLPSREQDDVSTRFLRV